MKSTWKDKKKLIAGIITLVLALLGGGGYYTTNQDGNAAGDNTTQVMESEYEPAGEEQKQESQVQDKEQESVAVQETVEEQAAQYYFRSKSLLESHYEKHGIDMGFDSAQEYEAAASKVVSHPDVLHKTEAEDGDDVYYVEATNEFVVVSGDGYIRTYFYPSAGIDYYNRQ